MNGRTTIIRREIVGKCPEFGPCFVLGLGLITSKINCCNSLNKTISIQNNNTLAGLLIVDGK